MSRHPARLKSRKCDRIAAFAVAIVTLNITLKTFSEIKPGLLKSSALALGFFDGVHPGHQAVIKTAVQEAAKLGITPALITFKEHPRARTIGKSPPLLSTTEQRLELCSTLGIEYVLLLSFTEELCRLSPEDYVRTVLVDCMGARSLSMGFNHRFGRNREGDPELLRRLGQELGFSVHVAKEVLLEGANLSSSRIREALAEARIEDANKLLGRNYSIIGEVIKGEGRGRKIGFPTANIDSPEELIVPANGVYSGVCVLPDGRRLASVINVGLRPTFGQYTKPCTEVHILDFNEDLYNQKVCVEFCQRIRDEKKFSAVDELVLQIGKDCQTARAKLSDSQPGIKPIFG